MAAAAKGDDSAAGVAYALAAFFFWGGLPIYLKWVDQVPALEVLAHRVVWSVLLLSALTALAGRWTLIAVAVKTPRTLGLLMLSTGIISLNWLVYIWAVFTDRVLETSLGYFINPLVSVLLGVIFLGERLRPWQVVAVALAGVGVLNLAFGAADFPWIALTLAFSFGTYGLIRKTVAVGSVDGLLVETTLLLPFAIAFLAYLAITGGGTFVTGGLEISVLLVLAAPVTALPLIWFTSAARRLRLSTVGFFQYIAPSCQFLLAVFLFSEPFTTTHLITFSFIWLALALFTGDSLLAARRLRVARF
jgi:chloramphenicol-sensitive protein RarD